MCYEGQLFGKSCKRKDIRQAVHLFLEVADFLAMLLHEDEFQIVEQAHSDKGNELP